DMVKKMAPKPIIFAMANPDPEITAEEVAAIRDDAIMATGRSDYPNQINNVLGFPYIFRGALDVRATAINMEMKICAAQALAALAPEDVPRCRPPPEIGSQILHPGPVQPALDLVRAARRRQRRHGYWRRPAPDRRHGRLPRAAALPAPTGCRRPAARLRA